MKDPIRKGQEAEELLNHPLLVETLDLIETIIREEWELAQDVETREGIWYTLQGALRFRNTLNNYVGNGKYESALKEQE